MRSIIKLTKEELENYNSPMVYLFIKRNQKHEEVILYIGKSKNGIARPFNPTHKAIEARKLTSEIRLYICESELEAITLEIQLIREHKPQYNKWSEGHLNLYPHKIEELKEEQQKEKEEKIEKVEEIEEEIPEWKRREALRKLKVWLDN